jgi:NAD(P)-dependent dehydrogenase (short-subunit alcohol dehydrogenase family)
MAKSGQVVVVTGASAGVGRATVRAVARRGARIGLLARGRDELEAAEREVEAAGGEAIVLLADVARHDQVDAAADRVERAFGPIDMWVNNAMTTVFSPVSQTTPAEFRRVTEVTYLPRLRARDARGAPLHRFASEFASQTHADSDTTCEASRLPKAMQGDSTAKWWRGSAA